MDSWPIRLKATFALQRALEKKFNHTSWGVRFCVDAQKENRHAVIGEAISSDEDIEIVFMIFVLEKYGELVPYHIIVEKEDGEQFAWILSLEGEIITVKEVPVRLSPFWNGLFPETLFRKEENDTPP